jgi:betaine-aldehyde dehydrogenase
MTIKLQNFINGEYREPIASEAMDIFNPADGKVYAEAPISSAADVDLAYKSAEKAFEAWRLSTPAERQLALLKIADAFEARAEVLADTESRDTGKPRGIMIPHEVNNIVSQIRFFAGAARNLEGRATGEYTRNHTSSIRREPIGVIGQITPWNYPMVMATWKLSLIHI